MNDGPPPGWYTDDAHGRRYWDGNTWLVPEPVSATANAAVLPKLIPEPEPAPAADEPPAPKATLESRMGMSKRTMAIIAGGALLLVIIAVSVAASVYAAGAPERDSAGICETELMDSLKSPATAVVSDVQTLDPVEGSDWILRRVLEALGVEIDKDTKEAFEQGAVDARKEIAKDAKNGIVTWMVVGEVDSENGFGAMVRGTWTCYTEWKDGQLDSTEVNISDE